MDYGSDGGGVGAGGGASVGRRGGSGGGAASTGGGSGRRRKGRRGKRRGKRAPEWAPPTNARSIWHEPGSRADLEQQMLLLQWRKADNGSRMKTVISNTRAMQEQDTVVALATDKTAEKAQWIQRVIREELSRPLWFDADRMEALEEDEQRELARVQRSIANQAKLIARAERTVITRTTKGAVSPTSPSASSSSLPRLRAMAPPSPEFDKLRELRKSVKTSKKALRKKKNTLTSSTVKAKLKTRPPAPVRLAETVGHRSRTAASLGSPFK